MQYHMPMDVVWTSISQSKLPIQINVFFQFPDVAKVEKHFYANRISI
jgi:hypothetical protein